MALGANPDNPTLDIKPLQGELYYRLRIGTWRVIYDRDDDVKIIAIEKLNFGEELTNEPTSYQVH